MLKTIAEAFAQKVQERIQKPVDENLLKEYYEPARTTTPRGCRLFLSVIEVRSSSFPKKAIYRKNNTQSAPNRRSQN